MKKSELKNKIHCCDSQFYCIVGPNTSGKSYFLDHLFDELDNAFYFHENGEISITDNRSKVKTNGGEYIYVDDKERGKIRALNKPNELISSSALQIVDYSLRLKETIDFSHISLGTKKLSKIIDSFLSYNLNNIKYVLIDEPENSLDDKNIKAIAGLINILKQNNFVVIMVTHSPRLLEIMNADLDDIYIFQRPFDDNTRHLTIDEAVAKFDSIGGDMIKLSKQFPDGVGDIDRMSFMPSTHFRKHYISSVLHSIEFYQTLFYLDAFIVEGLSELYLIKQIQLELPFANNYFVANGKFKIPFLIDLFSSLCETVHCFFDTDFKGDLTSFSSKLTGFITENFKNNSFVKLYRISKDLETFLGVDKKTIVAQLVNRDSISNEFLKGFVAHYKEYICLSLIASNQDAKNKIIKLFKDSEPNSQFDIFD